MQIAKNRVVGSSLPRHSVPISRHANVRSIAISGCPALRADYNHCCQVLFQILPEKEFSFQGLLTENSHAMLVPNGGTQRRQAWVDWGEFPYISASCDSVFQLTCQIQARALGSSQVHGRRKTDIAPKQEAICHEQDSLQPRFLQVGLKCLFGKRLSTSPKYNWEFSKENQNKTIS